MHKLTKTLAFICLTRRSCKLVKQEDKLNKNKKEKLITFLNSSVSCSIFCNRSIGNFLTSKSLTEKRGVWVEHESEISDPEEIKQILLKAGFIEEIIIKKKRIKGKIKDMEVCVDNLNKIGPYIECEIISNDKDLAFKRLSAFLKSIGIPEKNFEYRGYGRIFAEMAGIKFKD